MKVQDALAKMFPQAVYFRRERIQLSLRQIQEIESAAHISFEGRHAPEIIVHIAQDGEGAIGCALEDTVIGKWGPIHYLAGLDLSGKILQIVILDYQEIRGRPIAKRRFLRQYEGKTIRDPLRLSQDVDGISGATISSGSLTEGVRKILYIYAHIQP